MNTQRKTSPFSLFGGYRAAEDISYRYLADQLPDAFCLVAPRTGIFRYANRRALDLTGYSPQEFERLSLSELITPQDAPETLEQIHNLEAGLYRTFQNVPLKTKSGKLLFTDVRAAATVNDGEELVVILARDPEQRTLLERAYHHHHYSLTALDELAGLVMTRFQQSAEDVTEPMLSAYQRFAMADFVVLYRHAEQAAGYQLQKGVNQPADFPAIIAGIDPSASGAPLTWRAGERATSLLARAARIARLSVIHARAVGSGSPPPALIVVGYRSPLTQTIDTATLVETIANFAAVTQVINAHVAAHSFAHRQSVDTQRLYDTLQSETTEGVLRVDDQGRLLTLNRGAEHLLGFHAADTLGRPLEDVIISAQPVAQLILTSLQKGMRWGGVETDVIRRDGATTAVLIRALPLVEGDGASGGLILLTDRTDQRQFQVQSDHLERRAWLGDLSAIFAHDVRNPLNGIATGLNYLADRFDKRDPLADSVVKMQAEVNRIEQLLKNVLLVAKSNELNYQPVPLQQLLERIVSRWGNRLARRNVQLEQDIDPRTPPAMADIHQMDQVFTNLIVNALDAMSENGGLLTIKCHAANHPRTPHGDFVELLFSDTGPGIPPELLPRIFDPFITTKATGTGLGLAISKRILTAHKGSIFAESYPGIGTAFHIFIPVAKRMQNDE